MAVALICAAAASHGADTSSKALAAQLLGKWEISAVPNTSGGTDLATLSQTSGKAISLKMEGELHRPLGGSVDLLPNGDGSYSGKTSSGVEVRLRPVNGRRLDLTLQGKGLYFSVYLVK